MKDFNKLPTIHQLNRKNKLKNMNEAIKYPTWFLIYKDENGKTHGQTFGANGQAEANQEKQSGETVVYVKDDNEMKALASKHGFIIPDN
jgi:hypothetical protein